MKLPLLQSHLRELAACTRCTGMRPPAIHGGAVLASIMVLGQAPGRHEGGIGKPFAWKAGKTLFSWFDSLGVSEDILRQKIFFAAVARCFPGPAQGGGDRVPTRVEVANCSSWLAWEVAFLRPRLLIPIGALAIQQVLQTRGLQGVVGQQFVVDFHGVTMDVIPLPHPSGVSSWHKTEPGKTLLRQALSHINAHPEFRRLLPRKAIESNVKRGRDE